MQENRLYLSEVSLGGYKSIKDVSIDFEPNLNIIIGKNAAGKTNFLHFLHQSLTFNFDALSEFYSRLTFKKDGNQLDVKVYGSIEESFRNGVPILSTANKDIAITWNDEILVDDEDVLSKELGFILKQKNAFFGPTLITHGIPSEFYFVTRPINLRVLKGKFSSDIYRLMVEGPSLFFCNSVFISFIITGIFMKDEEFSQGIVEAEVNKILNEIEIIRKHLKQLTPIKDIRFNKSLTVTISEDQESFSINNLLLEFYIDGEF